jgi:hypothetical protein
MHLRRFLIYDVDTGQVIHVHVESAALGTPSSEVMAMVPAGGRRLEVFEESGTAEELRTHPVRVENGELRAAEAGTPMAGGGVRSRFAISHARRRHSRISPNRE